ncbi:MAG: hypothetical protein IJV91_07980, partial [Kiritimatiellae bacterium]|nr:hypothetical protein [Kiritimatiellia bacterium]
MMRLLNMMGIVCACGICFAQSVVAPINWDSPVGPVKPVNGVGQPPMLGLPRKAYMMHYLKEAGIPYSRLHDVGGAYGRMVYVDVPNIFRNFDEDENDPANYDFAFNDRLMDAIAENGVEPFYR